MQTRPENATLWRRVLHDAQLQNLPYKVETNEHGQIVLTPHKPRHSLLQSRLIRLLLDEATSPRLQAGEPTVEFAVETDQGVKVPDVVWISEERLTQIPEDAEASPVMPELVIEVLSEGNTAAEMESKRWLYFEGGAIEVWTCDIEGKLSFYGPGGEMPSSELVPSFPRAIQ